MQTNLDVNIMKIDSIQELDAYQRERLIVKISKPLTFCRFWFDSLPLFKTKTECFEKLNAIHFEIFGFYMYSDYNSFQNTYSRFVKQKAI